MLMTSASAIESSPFCAFHQAAEARLFRHALVRFAGLPVGAVDRLRCPIAARAITEILNLEAARRPLAGRIVERLHALIGSLDEQPALRLELIHLKRSVFNERMVALPPELTERIAQCDLGLARDLARWHDLTQSIDQRRSEAMLTLPEEIRAGRDALKDILRQPLFRSGIELANPFLSLNLQKFLDSSGSPDRRARLAERSALRYAYRTALKTSPFSTFTTVATADLEPASGGDLTISPSPGTVVSCVNINVGILARIAYRLEASPDIAKNLMVQLTTDWVQEDGRIRYLRQRTKTAGGDGPMEINITHELFDLPCSLLIEELIAIFDDRLRWPMDRLADRLARRTGVTWEEAFEVLLRLLSLDFLVAEGLRPIALESPLAGLCEALEAFENQAAKAVGASLRRVDSILSGGAFSLLRDRKSVLAAVSSELKNAFDLVQLPASLLPKTMVYEDVACAPAGAGTAVPSLEPHMENLLLLQRLLPLFNRYDWLRAGMTGYFAQKYGAAGCTSDIPSFAMEFASEYQQPYWSYEWFSGVRNPAEFVKNYFHSDALERIQAARMALGRYLRQEVEAHREADQLCLDPQELQRLTLRIAPVPLLANSLFLQFCSRGRSTDLVLNKVYGGLGQMFSRFAPLLADSPEPSLVSSLRAMLDAITPEGAIFAEVRGGVDTNLNLHPPLCEYEIGFPGEIHGVHKQRSIPLDDLSIQHDPILERLVLLSSRFHCEVIPVYHGFLLPGALPTVHQVLLNFSPLYIGDLSLASLAGIVPSETALTIPRIALGNVILERKTWFFGPEDLPLFTADRENDLDCMLCVFRWRRQHSIPERVFVRIQSSEATSGGREENEDNDLKFARKPTYVDFASLFSVRDFLHAIRKLGPSQKLVVTEMLPRPEDAAWPDAFDQFMTEIVVDLTQFGGKAS